MMSARSSANSCRHTTAHLEGWVLTKKRTPWSMAA